jgi:IclR family pca regulon transcriptional regulator
MPMAADTTSDKNIVRSLAKGLQVLQVFSAETPELPLAEVARGAGLDNATAFRMLNTLVMLGYVEKAANSRNFRLTIKCLDLGFNALAHSELRTLARPILRGLVGEVNEAASICVLEGPEILYVERIQAGLTRLGVESRIGTRLPAYATAVGQAMLGFLPRETQISVLESAPRPKLTERTLTDLDALLERLEQVRARGYALSDQEVVAGLRVLAAPILDIDGVPAAGISVAAPTYRMELEVFEEKARAPLLAAARALSRALQATGGVVVQSGTD